MRLKKNMIYMLAGTLLMAVATTSIYVPANIVTGGFSGISIIVDNIVRDMTGKGVPIWFSTFLLNIPLFVWAYKNRDRVNLVSGIVSAGVYNILLLVMPRLNIWNGDMLLGAVWGGAINGAGVALVLISGGSTGGSDLMAILLQLKYSHKTVPEILFLVDGLIVLAGAVYLGVDMALYAVISIYISSLVSDRMIEGPKSAKCVYIISEKSEGIADVIINEIERGVTGLKSVGMYSKRENMVIFTVISRKQLVLLRDVVKEADENAFFIVSDVAEVRGKGFLRN